MRVDIKCSPGRVRFYNLRPGDTFIPSHGSGEICLKLADSSCELNTFNLITNRLGTYASDVLVEHIHTVVTLDHLNISGSSAKEKA